MPIIIQIKDPFNPGASMIKTTVPEGFHTDEFEPDGQEGLQFTVSINNRNCPEGGRLHLHDVAVFIPKIHGAFAAAIIVALLVAVAIYFFLRSSAPGIGDGLPESDPTYTFKGQQNQIREGEAIEKFYGEGRHWPSYASRPYNQIIDNEQWYFGLFCVSLGPTEVTNVRIDDTLLSSFPGAESAVYQPGESVTLFPTSVHTAVEIASIELLGPNEPGHDWSGGFSIVPAGSKAYRLEFDLSFRGGLYKTNDEGEIRYTSVSAIFEIREIDLAGAPIGDWFVAHSFTKNLNLIQPQRFTIGFEVDEKRFEIRGKRLTNKSSDLKVRDALTWDSARSFLVSDQDFGNVTLLAVKLRATNSLNDNSRSTFNVDAKGTAWVYNSVTNIWAVQQTRSPLWAACDVLIADYGRNLDPSLISAGEIAVIAARKALEGIYYDGVIDQQRTIWDTIKDILLSSKCKPDLPGTRFSIIEDKAETLPTLCLNGYNIVKDSVQINHEFPKEGAKDSVEVEYTDPITWKRKTVLCKIGNDQGLNPERLKLPGCTNRAVAYRWGLYARATKYYGSSNVSLSTGLEGATIRFGGLVAVQHDLLPDGDLKNPDHTGQVTGDVVEVAGPYMMVPVPFNFDFFAGKSYRISLRKRNGNLAGPYTCLPSATDRTVLVDAIFDASEINTTEGEEPATYFFGETGKDVHFFKIIKIDPGQGDVVDLTLTPYDARLYSYGNATPPSESTGATIPTLSNTPTVSNLTGTSVPGQVDVYNMSWSPALGAIDYIVEKSLDGISWVHFARTTGTSILLAISPGHVYVRVAGSNQRTGPWAYWDGDVGVISTVPFAAPTPVVSQQFDGNTLHLVVDQIPLAIEYVWTIKFGTTQVITKVTTLPNASFTSKEVKDAALLIPVGIDRTLNIFVKGRNLIGDGATSLALSVTNDAPDAPTGLEIIFAQTIGTDERCIFNWDPSGDLDIDRYRVYADSTTGFVPGPGNIVSTTTGISAEKLYPKTVEVFWRVGAKDRWGDEYILSEESSFIP